MSRYPPLTIKELQAIQEANRDNPTVRRLLWEIHRLHQVMFQFDISMRRLSGDQTFLALETRSFCLPLLDNEPAVRRRRVTERRARQTKAPGIFDHYKGYGSADSP